MKKEIIVVGVLGVAAAYALYRQSRGKAIIPVSFEDVRSDFTDMTQPFLSSDTVNAQGQTTVPYSPPKTLGDYVTGAITATANDTAKIITSTGTAVQTMGGAAYNVASNISSGIAKSSQAISTTLGQVYSTVQTAVQPTINAVKSTASSIYTSAQNTLGSVYSWLTGR